MNNFKDKVAALRDSTKSQDVKALCENFLKGGEVIANESALLEGLVAIGHPDLLNEQASMQSSIMSIESKISKAAAARLMGSKVVKLDQAQRTNNVGAHVDEVKAVDSLNESTFMGKLSGIDKEAQTKLRDNFGIAEALVSLKTSSISKHTQVKYIIERFDAAIANRVNEGLIAKDFLAELAGYTWDKDVKNSYDKVKAVLSERGADVEVIKAMSLIKESDMKGFFGGVVDKLGAWLGREDRNIPSLVTEMRGWMFNSHVKNLVNNLSIYENSKGTTFNIPVSGRNCEVSKIYSPVVNAGKYKIFSTDGTSFYGVSEENMFKLSQAQVNALPSKFTTLCEAFFGPSVKVANESLVVYVGKNKVTISGDGLKVNEKAVTKDSLGTTLSYYAQGSIFGNTTASANTAVLLSERADEIVEIDFGKKVFSSLYENTGMYIFRKSNKMYIHKINAGMNENKFFVANGTQTVKFAKTFLSYDITESLGDLLTDDAEALRELETARASVLSNIDLIEGELLKIEKEIKENPAIAELDEIAEAKNLLSNELNANKSDWQTISDDIKSLTEADEDEEGEPEEIEAGKEEGEEEVEAAGEKEVDPEAGATDEVPADAAPEGEPAAASGGAEIPTNIETVVIIDPLGAAPAAPVDGAVADASIAPAVDGAAPADGGDAVSVGLAGAEGVQAQTQTITGNDHIDVISQAAPEGDQSVAQTGFAGAEGAQAQTAQIPVADTSSGTPAVAGVVPSPAPAASGDPAAAVPQDIDADAVAASSEVPAEEVEEPAAAEEGEPSDKEEAPGEEEEEEDEAEKKKSKLSEAIDVKSKVKLKGSDLTGVVNSIDSSTHKFSVAWSDGSGDDYELSQLEELAPEIADNIAGNDAESKVAGGEAKTKVKQKPVKKPEGAVSEEENTSVEAEEETKNDEPADAGVFVQAVVSIDFGPYKEGSTINVSASDFTAAGADDPIKVKDPLEEIATIPKKCIKITDEKPKEELGELETRVAGVIKTLQEIETKAKENDKINGKGITSALNALRKFTGAAKNDEQPKEEAEIETGARE